MDSDRLNRWLTLMANLGVLIGLLVVIYELRQNTEMMQAQINQSRSETALSEADAMYNSDYLPELLAKVHNHEQLSYGETLRFRAWTRGFHRNLDNMLWQYRAGFITENIPRSIEVAVTEVFTNYPLVKNEWSRTKSMHTDEYIAVVDSIVDEQD